MAPAQHLFINHLFPENALEIVLFQGVTHSLGNQSLLLNDSKYHCFFQTANTGTVHYVQNGQQVIIMTPTGPQQAVATTTNTGQTTYVVQGKKGYAHYRSPTASKSL